MAQHDHAEYVEGCVRCDLAADEGGTSNTKGFDPRTTVADLKRAIEWLPDDMPVMVRGGENDYTDASTIITSKIEWQTDRFGNALAEPQMVYCLVIE